MPHHEQIPDPLNAGVMTATTKCPMCGCPFSYALPVKKRITVYCCEVNPECPNYYYIYPSWESPDKGSTQ